MELKSDIILKGEAWDAVNRKMKGVFFDTLWDAFKISVSIGILYDSVINDDEIEDDKTTHNIPRTMFNRYSEEMSFFFKTAILTSTLIDFSEKDRLYLAFSEDVKAEELEGEDEEMLKNGVSDAAMNFDKIQFLKGFSNFGIEKIYECLTDNESETIENITNFLKDSYNYLTPELVEKRKIEELIEE